MSKKQPTNIDFVTDLMSFSNYGALAQVFVIEAIAEYADLCAAERLPDGSFISPDAWQGVAKEIQQKLNDRLASA